MAPNVTGPTQTGPSEIRTGVSGVGGGCSYEEAKDRLL